MKLLVKEHKFRRLDYVAIIGGFYYGENGMIGEQLRDSKGEPCYGVKITTGQYRLIPGFVLIHEEDLRFENA